MTKNASRVIVLTLLALFIFSLSSPMGSSNASLDDSQENSAVKIDSSLLNLTGNDQTDILIDYNDEEVNERFIENALRSADAYAKVLDSFSNLGIIHARIAADAIKRLAENDFIERITSNTPVKIAPLDFYNKPVLANGEEYESPIDLIGARDLWDLGYNGSGTVIAVLDTGADFLHPDLDDFDDNGTILSKVAAFASFVEFDSLPIDLIGHGTYATSVAAGTGNASEGLYAGIAPGATILAAKVTFGGLLALPNWIVSGIEWASSRGADIILMPFNTFGTPGDAVDIAVKAAVQRGIFVVAAAGDDGPDYLTVLSPGGGPECFTVGAYDTVNEEVPAFSGRGPSLGLMTKPDIVAPGTNIVGAKAGAGLGEFGLGDLDLNDVGDFGGLLGDSLGESIDENYIVADTTAASAAIVAGAAAILMQAFDRATPIVLGNVLRDTATELPYGANDAGAGLLNLPAAFDYLSRIQSPKQPENRTTGTPLLAFGITNAAGRNASTTLLMSNFGSTLIALDDRGVQETSLHLLMGMFSLKWNNEDPTNLLMFDIERELHQVAAAGTTNNYNRYLGVLSYDDTLFVTLVVESYNLSLVTPLPLTAFKITPYILNLGDSVIDNVSLYLSYSLDLFSDGLDDHGKYALGNQELFAYGISEDYGNFYFGVNSSKKLDAFEVGNSSEIPSHISNDNLTGSTSFDGSVGLGMKWHFGRIYPGQPVNVTIVTGFGENRTILDASIQDIWARTPSATFTNRGDLIVINADIPRTAQAGVTYKSKAIVMNVGVESSPIIAAMIIGEGENDSGALFGTYFNFEDVEPFHAKLVNTEWSPEKEGLHTAGWVVAGELGDAVGFISSPTQVLTESALTLSDDFLLRDLFVVTPITSTSVFPKIVPFGPFDIRFPIDFGLYSFSLSTTVDLGNLTIIPHGNATDWGNMSLNAVDSVNGFYNFSLFLLAPFIMMDGYHKTDYVLETDLGWTTNITLERTIQYPRAMMLMDTSHGGGFSSFLGDGDGFSLGGDTGGDVGGLPSFPLAQDDFGDIGGEMDIGGIGDLGNLGSLDDLLESIRLTTFSGLSNMKKMMAEKGLQLLETPGLELDLTLLSQFSAVFMFAPSEEFNSTDRSIMANYTAGGGKLILFGDYEDRANLTVINGLLEKYGYEMRGKHEKENTTEIVTDSILGTGMSSMWLGGGTFIVNNHSFSNVNLDGNPVVLVDESVPELVLFGSSRIFMNKHLVKEDNEILLGNLIEYLLLDTLTTRTSLSENTTRYRAGQSVYLNLEVYDYYGDPVNDLFVAIVFELPNGNQSFFIAGFVEDGLYSSQFTPSTWSKAGKINGIFIILRDEYAGTYASISFELYEDEKPIPTEEPTSLLTLPQIAFIVSIGMFGTTITLLVLNKYQRGKRYRIIEADTTLTQDIDNSFNMLLATFVQMEDLISREDMDRIQKVEALRTLMVSLEKARKEFENISDKVGGV